MKIKELMQSAICYVTEIAPNPGILPGYVENRAVVAVLSSHSPKATPLALRNKQFSEPRQRYKPQTKENESTIETARNYRKEEKKTKG